MFIHRETGVFLDTGQVITSVGPRASVSKNRKVSKLGKGNIFLMNSIILT